MLQFVVSQGGSLRFVAVRFCASNYTQSHIFAIIRIEEAHVPVRMCQFDAVRGGSWRFVAVRCGFRA